MSARSTVSGTIARLNDLIAQASRVATQRGLLDTYGQNLRHAYELAANLNTILSSMGSGRCVVGSILSDVLYVDDLKTGSNWISVRNKQCELYSSDDANAVTDANTIYGAAVETLAPLSDGSQSSIMDDLARLFSVKDSPTVEDDMPSSAWAPKPVSSISNIPSNLFSFGGSSGGGASGSWDAGVMTNFDVAPDGSVIGTGTSNSAVLLGGILALGAIAYLLMRR